MEILELIKAFFLHSNSREEWKRVRYPPNSNITLFGIIPIRICVLIVLILLETILILKLSDLLNFSTILQILLGLFYCYLIYISVYFYKCFVLKVSAK